MAAVAAHRLRLAVSHSIIHMRVQRVFRVSSDGGIKFV
jgi:hypothetical protein